MTLQLFKIRHLSDGTLQLLFQFGHVVAGKNEVISCALHVAADLLRVSCGVFKISAHGLLNLLAAVHEPKHDEEGHHCRHEIGIGHFPRASMVTAVATLLFHNDDGARLFHKLTASLRSSCRSCSRGGRSSTAASL